MPKGREGYSRLSPEVAAAERTRRDTMRDKGIYLEHLLTSYFSLSFPKSRPKDKCKQIWETAVFRE